MRVLVTGSAGFIGGYVKEELARRGHTAIDYDLKHSQHQDVRYAEGLAFAAKHADGVIHLAAILGTQETVGNPIPAIKTNMLGTANVLELCTAKDLPLVNICTGNAWMRDQGAGAYPITKEAASDLAIMYRDHRGLRVNQVRPVNAYGPRQSVAKPYGSSDVRKIIPSFITRAISGDPIEIYGDGTQVSDIVYVTDVAEALVESLVLAASGELLPTVSVGPTEHLSVNQIAHWIWKASGQNCDIVHRPMRRGEIHGDTTASSFCRFRPRMGSYIPHNIGLRDTFVWYAANRHAFWGTPRYA